MTIQPISGASVALYLTPADLKEHGLTPDGLTLERALTITRSAFQQAGIDLDGAVEIEAYPDSCGVLVFARVRPPSRTWFSFDELEDLLSGIHTLPPVQETDDATALVWWEGRWWLALPNGEGLTNGLPEFGSAESHRPYLDARLDEHGQTILSHNAVSTLRRYFPPLPPERAR